MNPETYLKIITAKHIKEGAIECFENYNDFLKNLLVIAFKDNY